MAFYGKLRGFQEEAVERMLSRQRLLVGYDMGLGKTVITIAAAEWLFDEHYISNVVVVCMASLKYQWRRMIDKFTNHEASVVVVDGSPEDRERQYKRAFKGNVDYTIIGYSQVRDEWEWVRDLPCDVAVGDEITQIKGMKAKTSRRMKRLQAPYIWGLTGQPIENRPEELYSIMQWIDEDVLGRFDIFDRTFIVRNGAGGRPKFYKNLPTLHETIAEAMVRKSRDDPDVRDELPQVGEEVYLIDFDRAGESLYRRMVADLLDELENALSFTSWDVFTHYSPSQFAGNDGAVRGRIMAKLTCLRMLCDNPELLRISAKRYLKTQEPDFTGSVKTGSEYAAKLHTEGLLDKRFATPKLDATLNLIEELLDASGRNKIVLFSYFKETLSIIEAELAAHGVDAVQFTGDMTAKQKDTAKQKFMDDKNCRLFLSSDAGGYGVDLPNANYLINYDLPWSAGKLDQRNARIIRLSSEFEAVTLINMLMYGSIEQRQYDMLEQKRAIASAIVDGKGIDDRGRLTLDLKTLRSFLQESELAGI